MIRTIVAAVHRYTCDRCGTERDVGSTYDPIEDWVNFALNPVSRRPDDPPPNTALIYCGECAAEIGLRPLVTRARVVHPVGSGSPSPSREGKERP